MRHCAHQSRLATPDKNGVAQRVHLEGLLSRGADMLGAQRYAEVLAELDRTECPESLEYLWERFVLLNGMRHEGAQGPAPFTPESIAAANALFAWQIAPHEVDALRLLDLAWRQPSVVPDDEERADG